MFKIGVFTGIDVYLLKNLYLGAEIGLQYATGRNPEGTYKHTEASGNTFEEKYKDYVKVSNFGFYCLPSVRIGWNF